MNRRRYFIVSMGLVSLSTMVASWRGLLDSPQTQHKNEQQDNYQLNNNAEDIALNKIDSEVDRISLIDVDSSIKDQLHRVKNFDQNLEGDIFLSEAEQPVFNLALARMTKIQTHAGYANFSLMSFDGMLKYARSYSAIDAFSESEILFMEKIFFHDAHDYGFMGEKVISSLTDAVAKKDIIKISHSGNFLFKGESLAVYERLKKDVGDSLILTSGIRSVVKQMHLFLDKTRKANGNLSRASRSLAPPGHSYHALGDFDVGTRSLGALNFTAEFAQTKEYQKLISLGYVAIRYNQENPFGVRYEPWHIKVV